MFRIKAENFLTFDNLEFDFADRGLVLIQGQNLDAALFHSNGAGKTNLVDCLCWGLYGKSLKGQSPDKVVNIATGKNCFVEVEWSDYRVIRYRKHTKFKNDVQFYVAGEDRTAKSNKDTQELIDKAIGLSYQSFVTSVYFQQSTLTSFANATDVEQKAIIEDILSLSLISGAQDWCKEKVQTIQAAIDAIGNKRQTLVFQIENFNSLIRQHEIRSQQFETTRDTELNKCKQSIANLEEQQKSGSDFDLEQARALVTLAEPLVKEIQQIDQELTANRETKAKLSERAKYLAIDIQRKNKDIENVTKTIEHYHTTQDPTCPTCGQSITNDFRQQQFDSADQQILTIQMEIQRDQNILDSVTDSVNILERKILADDAAAQEKRTLVTVADRLRKRIMEEEYVLKQAELVAERLMEARGRLHEVETRQNPHVLLIGEDQEKLHKVEVQLAELTVDIADLMAEQTYYQYWVEGFSNQRLKSYIMDSITPVLNERANFYSQFLTGGVFDIQISTQTKLKSGELRDKFAVNIDTASGADYELSSGGERKRIDICILLALQDLVASRATHPIQLLVMDEVSENLDDIGVERMLELLHNITSTKASCFYITHDEGMKPLFPSSVTVTKQNGVSKLSE
jgi:DNA repair exonuclease SbcCD ATPase subunit